MSKIYDTLKYVEEQRKLGIRNINLINKNKLSSDATLGNVVNEILFIDNSVDDEETSDTLFQDKYLTNRDSKFPNLHTLITNAQNETYNGTTYYPTTIMLFLVGSTIEIDVNMKATGYKIYGDNTFHIATTESINKSETNCFKIDDNYYTWVIIYNNDITTQKFYSFTNENVIEAIFYQGSSISNSFENMGKVKYLYFCDNFKFASNEIKAVTSSNDTSVFNSFYLESIRFPEGLTKFSGVYRNQIMRYVPRLKYIGFPTTLTTISYFLYCSITSQTDCGIEYLKFNSTVSISNSFQTCRKLKEVIIPPKSTVSFSFFRCANLKKITGCYFQNGLVENSIEKLDFTNSDMNWFRYSSSTSEFSSLKKLKKIIFSPKTTTFSIDSTFGETSVEEIILNDNITNVYICSSGQGLYSDCLKKIKFPTEVRSLYVSLGGYYKTNASVNWYYEIPNLEFLDLPYSVSSDFRVRINNLNSLKILTLPQDYTNDNSSYGVTIVGCSSLKELKIPDCYKNFKNFYFSFYNSWIEYYDLPQDFDMNNINFSSTYTYLEQKFINELPTKLKDHSEDGESRTIIVGSTNLAKFSEEQLAEISRKGWSIY